MDKSVQFRKTIYLEMTKIFILLFVVVAFTDARKLTYKSLECLNHNDKVCGDLACSVGKKQKTISMGCTLTRPTDVMRSHIKMSFTNPKMSSPHSVEATMDFCDIVNNRIESAAINMGMPLLRTFLPQFAKSCPYSGRLEVTDFDPNEIMSMLPPISPLGDYTVEFELFNDRNESIVHPKMQFSIKK